MPLETEKRSNIIQSAIGKSPAPKRVRPDNPIYLKNQKRGAELRARAKHVEREARRALRKAEKAERLAAGIKGAPIDWDASTTGAQPL